MSGIRQFAGSPPHRVLPDVGHDDGSSRSGECPCGGQPYALSGPGDRNDLAFIFPVHVHLPYVVMTPSSAEFLFLRFSGHHRSPLLRRVDTNEAKYCLILHR